MGHWAGRGGAWHAKAPLPAARSKHNEAGAQRGWLGRALAGRRRAGLLPLLAPCNMSQPLLSHLAGGLRGACQKDRGQEACARQGCCSHGCKRACGGLGGPGRSKLGECRGRWLLCGCVRKVGPRCACSRLPAQATLEWKQEEQRGRGRGGRRFDASSASVAASAAAWARPSNPRPASSSASRALATKLSATQAHWGSTGSLHSSTPLPRVSCFDQTALQLHVAAATCNVRGRTPPARGFSCEASAVVIGAAARVHTCCLCILNSLLPLMSLRSRLMPPKKAPTLAALCKAIYRLDAQPRLRALLRRGPPPVLPDAPLRSCPIFCVIDAYAQSLEMVRQGDGGVRILCLCAPPLLLHNVRSPSCCRRQRRASRTCTVTSGTMWTRPLRRATRWTWSGRSRSWSGSSCWSTWSTWSAWTCWPRRARAPRPCCGEQPGRLRWLLPNTPPALPGCRLPPPRPRGLRTVCGGPRARVQARGLCGVLDGPTAARRLESMFCACHHAWQTPTHPVLQVAVAGGAAQALEPGQPRKIPPCLPRSRPRPAAGRPPPQGPELAAAALAAPHAGAGGLPAVSLEAGHVRLLSSNAMRPACRGHCRCMQQDSTIELSLARFSSVSGAQLHRKEKAAARRPSRRAQLCGHESGNMKQGRRRAE